MRLARLLTVLLADAAATAGIRRYVLISSTSVSSVSAGGVHWRQGP